MKNQLHFSWKWWLREYKTRLSGAIRLPIRNEIQILLSKTTLMLE